MSKLLHGDCLELMKDIPDASIDLILTDPPYGTTACKWDSVIPFEPMWKELKRIRKDNAAIVLFGNEPFSSHLRMSNIKEFKYDWYWNKKVSAQFMNAKLKPMNRTEIVSVFSKGTTANRSKTNMNYLPQGLIHDPKIVTTRKASKTHLNPGYERPSHKDKVFREFTNYPYSDLNFIQERSLHPTQKPVALLEYLIKTYTREGEVVLDFTMGSGSTGVAAKNLNRKFIGIEKDLTYYDIATKRIYETLSV